MTKIQDYNSLDEVLLDISKKIKPLYYINPINEKQQKDEFFLFRKTKNPEFKYKDLEDLEYDTKKTEQRLESIEIPEGSLMEIFQRWKKDRLLENRIIANLGDEDIIRDATITIHGFPDEALVNYADELLKQIPNIEYEKKVRSNIIKKALEVALDYNKLIGWDVEFSEKRLTTIYTAEKKITICKDRKFAEIDTERLKVHEVVVHTFRAANGYEQLLSKIFALGFPGFLPTEEGLAIYFEELTGNTSNELMRDYAARVIAVDSVLHNLDFKQTFDRLKSYDLTEDQAWNLSVRAHRGGGYIKDHVYLSGSVKIKDFAKNDGDFRTLYVGKIGIEHLPLVRKLLKEGTLKEAKYIPRGKIYSKIFRKKLI